MIPAHADTARALDAMVDSQIYTGGVTDAAILDAFRTTPRDRFVPPSARALACCDEDVPLGRGRVLVEPLVHARLLQAALPVMTDRALDVASGTGYPAVILSSLVSSVVSVESDSGLLGDARAHWSALSASNITPVHGAIQAGAPAQGPYTLIVINGGVADVPQPLFDQLAPGGRLVAVVMPAGLTMGQGVLFSKGAQGAISRRALFDAAVPVLPECAALPGFVF